MNNHQNNQLLQVKIISPKEDIFAGLALSISSKNSAGKFDILPEHANFITLVQNEQIIIKTQDKQIKTYKFPLAIIYNANNKVNIYTDIQLSLHTH